MVPVMQAPWLFVVDSASIYLLNHELLNLGYSLALWNKCIELISVSIENITLTVKVFHRKFVPKLPNSRSPVAEVARTTGLQVLERRGSRMVEKELCSVTKSFDFCICTHHSS
jgi:hypothetical protein